MVGALVLAILPLLWAGSVRQIYPATSSEMVERLVPTTVTYVGISAFAMSVPFPAPGGAERPPYGLLVLDSAASSDVTVISSATDPRSLLSRTVTGRLTPRPYGDAAAALFAGRGDETAGLDTARVLIEVLDPDPDESVTAVESVADLATVPDDALVRVPLAFDGESTPTCVLAAACGREVLAAGTAVFVHLAHGGEAGDAILVQAGYPSSLVPGQWQGPQIRNGEELEDFAATVGVQSLAGWSRILLLASIVDDPELIRDRLWLGPILLALLAALLWVGGRIGYPYFRPMVGGSRRWTAASTTASATASTPAGATAGGPADGLAIRVSGHALTTIGQRRNLDEEPAILHRAEEVDERRVTAAIDLADGAQIPLAAHDTGLLGRVERGEVVSLRGVRPALWAHWYGTDLRMTFEAVAARDLAADLVGPDRAPVRSAP